VTAENKLTTGPVVIAGNWEPLIFRRRCNDPEADLAEKYAAEHTEEAVAAMKEAGINLLITHYHKGFGLKAEEEDIKNAKKLIALCHQNDIRVGGYIGDTYVLETMLSEDGDAVSWGQFEEDGTPIRFAGTQNYRFKWCIVNPAYEKYMKKVLQQAIADGLDMIHLDNYLYKPEPYSCHCSHCVEAFRMFLKNKYSEAELTARIGHADLANMMPPTFITPLYLAWARDLVLDPITQEWIDFKCQTVGGMYKKLGDYCRSIKSDIVMECNPAGFWGENSLYMRSSDCARTLPHGSFFWDESPNEYGLFENGALRTNVISMKMGEHFSDRMFYYLYGDTPEETKRKIGEGLAFNNGCIGMLGFLDGNKVNNSEVPPLFCKYLHANAEDFCETTSLAKAALYRNFHSFAYNSYEPYVQAILCQQTLIQKHISFDMIWEGDKLSDYKCIILDCLECLSLKEIAEFKEYVRAGGKIIMTESCGTFDEWYRKYPENQFADLLEDQGSGSCCVISDLKMSPDSPGKDDRAIWDECYKVLDGKFWIMPENADELAESFAEADLLYKTSASKDTVVELREGKDGKTLMLHIINFAELQEEIEFELNMEISDLTHLSIEDGKSSEVKVSVSNGKSIFKINNKDTYSYLKMTRI